jgi:hypothetical protein
VVWAGTPQRGPRGGHGASPTWPTPPAAAPRAHHRRVRVRPFRRPEARLAGAIAIAAVLAACGGDPDASDGPDLTPRPDAAPPASGLAARVRLLYVAASDETAGEIAVNVARLEQAITGIQGFYSDTMGAEYSFATFRFDPAVVLHSMTTKRDWGTCATDGLACPRDAADPSDRCHLWFAVKAVLREGGLLAGAGLPSLGTGGTHYHAAVAGADGGTCGAPAWLSVSGARLVERGARDCPSGRWDALATDCAPVGAIAHELGHGFGLSHCEGPCDAWGSIMWNWTAYDRRATLDDAERAALAVSPFFLPR